MAANKAAGVHATHLEKNAKRAIEILERARQRGEAAVEALPDEPNAHYMLAFVLGRFGQRISILKALAAGLASRIRSALERTLQLEPRHADAHIAFGVYHAAIVSQVGSLVARLTYGASRAAAIEHFERALKLAPHTAIARLEYADALLLLDEQADREHVRELYREAASFKPMDAMEALDVERARKGGG
jgi:tetratricopeptide (TPR) repeat protein